MAGSDARDWKLRGVRVIHSTELDPNTAQTPGMNRAAAITHARTGAEKLWAGTVTIHPTAKTGAHHHGALESVIYGEGARPDALGRSAGVHRRGRAGRLHLHPSLRPAPGDQRRGRAAGMRAGPQRDVPVVVNLDLTPVEPPESVYWVDDVHKPPGP